MLKIYIIGLIILLAAILFNIVASKLNIMGWYDFLTHLVNQGKSTFSQMRWLDYAWLFLFYPFLLGLICKLAIKWVF
jgi:hypothetical protein